MTTTSPTYHVPEPHSTTSVSVGEGESIILRRHGNPDGIRILLSHGNGLAADLYYPLWKLLLDDFDVVVFDCRNHGWNGVGQQAKHNPMVFADDLDNAILPELDRAFGKRPTVGFFHSLSALVSLLLPSRGAAFAGLVLFDPPLCIPGMPQRVFEAHGERLVHALRIREQHYPNLEGFQAIARLNPVMKPLNSATIRLFATTCLRPSPDGSGYVIRCPATYEAQAVEFITAFAAIADVDSMQCPIKVIGADPTIPFSFLPSFDLSVVATVDYDFIPGASHHLVLERPEACCSKAMEFLERLGLSPPLR